MCRKSEGKLDEYGAPIFNSRQHAEAEKERKKEEKAYKKSDRYKYLRSQYGNSDPASWLISKLKHFLYFLGKLHFFKTWKI